MRSDMLMRQIK